MRESGLEEAFVNRRAVQGYEGSYSVTSDGRVWSEERVIVARNGRKRRCGSCWLTPIDIGDGYQRVNLRIPGHISMKCIHWLVARAFLPKPIKGREIDHIDRNPSNNHLSNLRYVSKTKNILNRDSRGTYFRKQRNRWQATLRYHGKRIILGQFKTEAEAHQAYVEAKDKVMKRIA